MLHEWFRRKLEHSSTLISFVVCFNFNSHECRSIYSLSHSQCVPNKRCVYPVCHLRKWLRVRYLYIRIISANSLLFDTNLIFSLSLSLSFPLAFVFVVNPAKTFQYSFVPWTTPEKFLLLSTHGKLLHGTECRQRRHSVALTHSYLAQNIARCTFKFRSERIEEAPSRPNEKIKRRLMRAAHIRPFQFQLNNIFFCWWVAPCVFPSKRLEIWVWNALFKCFFNWIEKFCVLRSISFSHFAAAAPFHFDENRAQSYASRTLFVRLLFLLCVESRDEIHFIFDFLVSLDANTEWPVWKWEKKKKQIEAKCESMCVGHFDGRHETWSIPKKRNQIFELAKHE